VKAILLGKAFSPMAVTMLRKELTYGGKIFHGGQLHRGGQRHREG
jgi:hypothetical protein